MLKKSGINILGEDYPISLILSWLNEETSNTKFNFMFSKTNL